MGKETGDDQEGTPISNSFWHEVRGFLHQELLNKQKEQNEWKNFFAEYFVVGILRAFNLDQLNPESQAELVQAAFHYYCHRALTDYPTTDFSLERQALMDLKFADVVSTAEGKIAELEAKSNESITYESQIKTWQANLAVLKLVAETE
jgi:hypothetical protein